MFIICSLLASRLAFATTHLIDDFVDEIVVCFTLSILRSHCIFSLYSILYLVYAVAAVAAAAC